MAGRRAVTDDVREDDRAMSVVIAAVCFVSMAMLLGGFYLLGLLVGMGR